MDRAFGGFARVLPCWKCLFLPVLGCTRVCLHAVLDVWLLGLSVLLVAEGAGVA